MGVPEKDALRVIVACADILHPGISKWPTCKAMRIEWEKKL